MAKDSKNAKAAREAAAQARAAAQASERSRERKIRIIGGIAVVAVMAALLAIPLLSGKNKGADTNANAALPKGVTSDTYGVKVGTAWTAANADSIPILQIWEDFQCPACGQFEKASGEALTKLVDEGKLRLEWRPTIFLDSNLSADNTANGNPESSLRATNAFGCAVDQGYAEAFHSALFAAQPATEGQGYSAADLTAAAQSAGMSDQELKTFNDCSNNKVYDGWVKNSFAAFEKDGISSTPSGILNGTELTSDVMFNPDLLVKAIADATK